MTWLLIDGNNWFAQCEYACPGGGTPNFKKRLDTVCQQLDHSRTFVCWDGGRSWRCDLDPQYKAHREAKTDWYRSSLSSLQEEMQTRRDLVSISSDAYEADDLIATLAAMAHGEGEKAILFSADKDLHQLITAGTVTQVINVKRVTSTRMSFETINSDKLLEKYGVHPFQWVDYRAIVGDDSDGIKGCKGLGPKAAVLILQSCGLLSKYFEDPTLRWACNLTARQRALLDNYRNDLPNKRRLLQLCDSVPLPASLLQQVAGAVT